MEMRKVGQLTVDEFEQLKEVYLETHKRIDPEAVLDQIKGLDAQIEDNMKGLDAHRAMAINILLQGRNFLAMLLGNAQLRPPKGVTKLISKMTGRAAPVAIYCHNQTIARTIEHVLSNLNAAKYLVVSDPVELSDLALHDELQGVIGVSTNKHGNVEASIRHDLKHMPGWDYEKAEAVELPPCRDLHAGPQLLAKLLFTLQDMHELPAEQMHDPIMSMEVFNLRKAIGDDIRNLCEVTRNSEVLHVAVCDDTPSEVEGLRVILESWPNLMPHFHDAKDFKDAAELAYMIRDCDIALLDENMGHITGQKMFDDHHNIGSASPVFASITGGAQPRWADLYFQGKARVLKEKAAALDFVAFLELCIKERQRRRSLLNS